MRVKQLRLQNIRSYADQTVEFPEGTIFSWRLAPAGVSDRTPEEIRLASLAVGVLVTATGCGGCCRLPAVESASLALL